jgi:opacity protein-like surface antigen
LQQSLLEECGLVQRYLIAALLLLMPVLAAAQSVYDAQRSPIAFSAGGSYSYFDAAYGGYHIVGLTAYADLSPILWDRLGVEGEGRWLTFNTSNGFREYTYLIGPRYQFSWSKHRGLHPYIKTLAGEGVIDFPNHTAYGRYFVFAPAGGVDINVVNRWRIRAEYEYQFWPGAPGIPGLPSGAMEPNGVSVGINYRIF